MQQVRTQNNRVPILSILSILTSRWNRKPHGWMIWYLFGLAVEKIIDSLVGLGVSGVDKSCFTKSAYKVVCAVDAIFLGGWHDGGLVSSMFRSFDCCNCKAIQRLRDTKASIITIIMIVSNSLTLSNNDN